MNEVIEEEEGKEKKIVRERKTKEGGREGGREEGGREGEPQSPVDS